MNQKDIKYCISIRGSDVTISLVQNKLQAEKIKKALSLAQGIHTISKYLKEVVIDLGIQDDKITVIPRLISKVNSGIQQYNHISGWFIVYGVCGCPDK